MSRPEWYLIVGLAKTGTTAVAMTLRNTLKISKFLMEPGDLASIERASGCDRLVVKIIFDHWQIRVDVLKKFVRGGLTGHAPTTIILLRDPRDEAISRLHYAAFNYFSTQSTTDEQCAAWIEIFRRKEETPDVVALIDMQDEIKSRFGAGFLTDSRLYQDYVEFIDELMAAESPAIHLLRYEEFIDGTIANETLRTLLSGSRDVDPLFHRVRRSGSRGDWEHYLTDRDLALIEATCGSFLRRFTYPSDRKNTTGGLSRANGSEYVEKLIHEARRQFANRLNHNA